MVGVPSQPPVLTAPSFKVGLTVALRAHEGLTARTRGYTHSQEREIGGAIASLGPPRCRTSQSFHGLYTISSIVQAASVSTATTSLPCPGVLTLQGRVEAGASPATLHEGACMRVIISSLGTLGTLFVKNKYPNAACSCDMQLGYPYDDPSAKREFSCWLEIRWVQLWALV